MKLEKRELFFWESKYGIKKGDLDHLSDVVDRLRWKDSELTDEELGFITKRIKVVHQFDLDNTEISDEGIIHLLEMRSITELRLKGCGNVTAKSIPVLNQLTDLELLHLGGTSIVPEDALGLSNLQQLKLLLLSDDASSSAEIEEKAFQLQYLLPDCEININHKVYSF